MVSVPKILPTAATCVTPPVNPIPEGEAHVYVVPAGINPFVILTGVSPNATPPHTVVVIGVMVAVGLIDTTTVKLDPLPQEVVIGVTI